MWAIKLRLPRQSKSWKLKYRMIADGKVMNFRERMIYEAGFQHGLNSKNLEERLESMKEEI